MDRLDSSPYILETMCLNSFELLEQKSISVLTLKLFELQHSHEIKASANATKVERIGQMAYGEIKAYLLKYRYVLSVERMGNQPPSSE